MDNKFNKRLFSYLEEEDLTFTKEDRIETFKKIKRNNKNKKTNNNITFIQIGKRYIGPILGTVMVFILAIGLLLPNLYSGNEIGQENPNKQLASQQEGLSFSALVMGKDSTTYRNNITILLTYNSSDKSLTLVPIPRDTYVELINSEGEMIREDKIVHALALESTPESAMKTVSNLFDFSIDYYFVIPEENIYAALEVAKDDVKVNQSQTNEIGNLIKEQLSITEIRNLLNESETNIPSEILNQFQVENSNSESIQVIDMTDYYFVIPEENVYTALDIDEIGYLIKEQLSLSEIENLFKESETNIPSDILDQFQMENSNSESIQVIDMVEKGIEGTVINNTYYVVINQKFLESTSDTLKQHLNNE